jgi:hypothetical protein
MFKPCRTWSPYRLNHSEREHIATAASTAFPRARSRCLPARGWFGNHPTRRRVASRWRGRGVVTAMAPSSAGDLLYRTAPEPQVVDDSRRQHPCRRPPAASSPPSAANVPVRPPRPYEIDPPLPGFACVRPASEDTAAAPSAVPASRLSPGQYRLVGGGCLEAAKSSAAPPACRTSSPWTHRR